MFEFKDIIEKALVECSQGEYFKLLVDAKDLFFKLTGKLNDDDFDYENRMSSFNDWYLFHFIPEIDTRTPIKSFLLRNGYDKRIIKLLLDVNYSLYEFLGKHPKKGYFLKDLIRNNKIKLFSGHENPSLVIGDIFTGRTISDDQDHLLLDGVCVITERVKERLLSEAKKTSKYKSENIEYEFLIRLEFFRSKWKRYSHLDPHDIFLFD